MKFLSDEDDEDDEDYDEDDEDEDDEDEDAAGRRTTTIAYGLPAGKLKTENRIQKTDHRCCTMPIA